MIRPLGIFVMLFAALASGAEEIDARAAARFRSSWITVNESTRPVVEGQPFTVTVDYHLADGPGVTLVLSGHGPWIDLPDGKYETKRHHVDYPGLYQECVIPAGTGKHVFTFTGPKLFGRDSLLWIARFKDGDQTWPWEMRAGGSPMVQADRPLTLVGKAPGQLFTYAEPVSFEVQFGKSFTPGTAVAISWSVIGRDGKEISAGTVASQVPPTGTSASLTIPCDGRGVFGLRVVVNQATAVETTFARIPDLMSITKGESTRFGLHNVLASEARMKAARRMGLTFCRQFVSWKELEPAPGVWHLQELVSSLKNAKTHGIDVMICFIDPPAWAMKQRFRADYEPFAFDEQAWSEAITTISRACKGTFVAWEWLNEIVPGPESNPVEIYLSMVRLGNAAAKAEDPQLLSVMAGGLWPRSFRLALLTAGIGKHIDVLPIHYGAGAGVTEALADLAAVSAANVAVWDDESSHGVSTWGMPMDEALAYDRQRTWAMTNFTSELAAGAQRVIWFGGAGDPAGNWDFCWSDGSPRPVAATLAVLAAKLHRARAQGSFSIAGSGPIHLFAVDGKAVVVAPMAKEPLRLRVGSAGVVITDDQGEERQITATQADVELPASAYPTLVEGGDLEVLRGYTAPEVLTPHVSVLAGREEQVQVRLTNRSHSLLQCEISITVASGMAAIKPVAVSLAADGVQVINMPIAVAAGTAAGEHAWMVTCRYSNARMPVVNLPWQLSVIDVKQLGSLLVNGDFEQGTTGWNADPTTKSVSVEQFSEGLGSSALCMGSAASWQSASQSAVLNPGQKYLYSMWMRITDKQAGSNIDELLKDGTKRTLYIPQVFTAAQTADWQFVSKIYQAPDDLAHVAFTPVANGAGEAWFDQARLTTYEGTNYAAEAARCTKSPLVDGDLTEWEGGCPIPLLGPGQSNALAKQWVQSTANCRGLVKLRWDEANLYLAAWVDDDTLAAPETGERTIDSDSLVLALNPERRDVGSVKNAFCYYMSPASPGGGSGTSTLFRPAAWAGGHASGQLAKDSSVYEVAIRRVGTRTLYEIRFPWSELGCHGHLGLKLGCSLQLNDNDGAGRAGYIAWGDGLAPAWNPAAFGVLTLVE